MKHAAPLALALVVALSACTTIDPAQQIADQKEYVTGSRLPQKRGTNLGKPTEEDMRHLERDLGNATDVHGRKDF